MYQPFRRGGYEQGVPQSKFNPFFIVINILLYRQCLPAAAILQRQLSAN